MNKYKVNLVVYSDYGESQQIECMIQGDWETHSEVIEYLQDTYPDEYYDEYIPFSIEDWKVIRITQY